MDGIKLNYWAILVCVMISFFLGYLWFSVIFSKVWLELMDFKDLKKPSASDMMKSMGISLVGTLITTLVIALFMNVVRVIMIFAGGGGNSPMYAIYLCLILWLGFSIPMHLNRVSWEFKSFKLVILNSSYDLVRYLISGIIIWYWY